MTSPTPIRRHSSGRRHQIGSFDLPVPSSEAEALLPDPVREARNKVLELAQLDNEAQGAIYTTNRAIEAAEQLDADDLGAAILAGQPDPGPVNATAARAAHADARRRAEGYGKALATARQTYYNAVSATDCTDAVDALEALAATELAKAHDALAVLDAAFSTYRGLRSLAESLALFPDHPAGFQVDAQDYARGLHYIRTELAAMRPDHDVPAVRAVATAESDFTPDAYTPPDRAA